MEQLKILVPVDFTEQSRYAVHFARNFTDKFEVEVIFLHVLELSAFADVNRDGHFEDLMGINTDLLELQRKEALDKMEAFRRDEQRSFQKVSTHMKLGPLTETIISFAHHRKVDMILMGTKGADSMRAWLSGSETQIVARRSEIPVLSVMCDRSDHQISNLLFISDFKDIEQAPDPVVTKLARGLGATLHLLCIAPPDGPGDEELEQCMNDYMEEHSLPRSEFHIHREQHVVQGIHHFDGMEEMDLIALGTHGRKGIRHLIRGSIAEKLINHLYKPVLVYRI